jgi:hypothetical protein
MLAESANGETLLASRPSKAALTDRQKSPQSAADLEYFSSVANGAGMAAVAAV